MSEDEAAAKRRAPLYEPGISSFTRAPRELSFEPSLDPPWQFLGSDELNRTVVNLSNAALRRIKPKSLDIAFRQIVQAFKEALGELGSFLHRQS